MEPVMVETVRIPIKSNKAKPNETGFPFDDSEFDDRDRSDRSFRSHIDDIINRHPELAEHLNFDRNLDRFPFRSNTWGNKRRGSSSGDDSRPSRTADSRRFARPFGSNFEERFGFPFNRTFNGDPEFRKQDSHHQEKPEYKPAATPEQTETQKEATKKESSQENICEKPPQVPIQDRGRKQHPHIPQSNTVDLGQKQDPVCDNRGQRSMSAPPENRAGQQRFVSSVNIPMKNTGDGNHQSQQAKAQSTQQQQQGKSHERVIPIHVEGRDEPVIPKRAGTPSQAYESETSSQPQPQRVFGQKPAGFGHWERSNSPYYTGEPMFGNESQYFDGAPQYFMNRSEPHQQRTNAEDYFTGPHKQQQQQQEQSQQQCQKQQQQKPPQQPQHENAAARQATPPPQQAAPPPAPKGPIDQIKNIQKEVLQLMDQVVKFNGKPKDKQYIYLDEMLTRNLLKLDDVDTEGKDNIRQARKEAINCIQRCINILEAKAAANEQLRSELMDVDAKIENAIAANEVQTTTEPIPITSLEISGTARLGVEVLPSASENENPEMDTSQPVSEQVPEVKEEIEASDQDKVAVLEFKGSEEQQKEDHVGSETKENELKVEETPKEGESTVESTNDTSNTSQPTEVPKEEVKDKKEKKKVKKKEKTATKSEEK